MAWCRVLLGVWAQVRLFPSLLFSVAGFFFLSAAAARAVARGRSASETPSQPRARLGVALSPVCAVALWVRGGHDGGVAARVGRWRASACFAATFARRHQASYVAGITTGQYGGSPRHPDANPGRGRLRDDVHRRIRDGGKGRAGPPPSPRRPYVAGTAKGVALLLLGAAMAASRSARTREYFALRCSAPRARLLSAGLQSGRSRGRTGCSRNDGSDQMTANSVRVRGRGWGWNRVGPPRWGSSASRTRQRGQPRRPPSKPGCARC